MSATVQSSFLASSRANSAVGRHQKRRAETTKAKLEQMVLHNTEVQSGLLRRENENKWVWHSG